MSGLESAAFQDQLVWFLHWKSKDKLLGGQNEFLPLGLGSEAINVFVFKTVYTGTQTPESFREYAARGCQLLFLSASRCLGAG